MSSRRRTRRWARSPRMALHMSATEIPLARNAARRLPALTPTKMSKSRVLRPRTMKSSRADRTPSSYTPPVIPPPPRISAAFPSTGSRIGIRRRGCKRGILCAIVGVCGARRRGGRTLSDMTRRLLFLLAHPDDETFGPGGTIARYASEGADVFLATATRGEAGIVGEPPLTDRDHLGEVRAAELLTAAGILGAR